MTRKITGGGRDTTSNRRRNHNVVRGTTTLQITPKATISNRSTALTTSTTSIVIPKPTVKDSHQTFPS